MSILHMDFAKGKTATPSELDSDIAEYLEKAQGDYRDELIANDSRIQVWQLLSELRSGLVSWYDFKEGANVLEVGAGFGALTGVLCEKCAHVTVTERSVFRAEQIAKRFRTVDNLDVYAGDVLQMSFSGKFDYILLVGLLERIGKGSSDLCVYAAYLKKLKNLLTEGGKILLAVENRMGLKYFCGATDPHTNKAFSGLNHYKQGSSGYTFSKKEVQNLLKMAGFEHTKFYYPLPDYKLPQMVYTDGHLPQKNLRERLIPYHKRTDTFVAVEKELYNDIIENEVFPFFANSFFVECSLNADVGQVSYAAVSTDRGREKSFATVIYEDGTVKKTFLYPEGRKNADTLMANMEDLKAHGIPTVTHEQDSNGVITQPFITWPTMSNVLKELIKTDISKFLDILDQIYAYILQSSEQVDSSENAMANQIPKAAGLDFGPILRKAYMELIPLNCFYSIDEDRYLYFDQEFVRENYPAQYVMFRAIHYIYVFTDNAEKYYPKQQLIDKYGMTDTWKYYMAEEKRFLDEVRNHKLYEQFYKWAKIDGKRVLDNADRLESEEEVIANYRVSDKMKKIWKVELQILDEIDRICKKYGLRYFLVHGSLLGAVRHKGFIPWDDDLDVAMPRADYDKFMSVVGMELKDPLSIHNAATESDNFWGGYARIRNKDTSAIVTHNLNHEGNKGIWVDMLPFDVCTMDEQLFSKKEKQIKKYYALLSAKTYGKERKKSLDKNAFTWKMYWLCSHLYSRKYLAAKLDWAVRLYTDKESLDVAFFTGYQKFRRYSAKDFADCIYMTFEKRQIPVPVGYENFMVTLWGKDYMKYPPKEERKPKHTGIWDPDVPYTQYQERLCNMFEGVKGKKLILWGSGFMFEDYMKKYGGKYRPAYLVDNDENKWGRTRMGIEICSPKKLLEIPRDKFKLIICSYYYKEIGKQLENMGITDYKVYVQHTNWIIETENK